MDVEAVPDQRGAAPAAPSEPHKYIAGLPSRNSNHFTNLISLRKEGTHPPGVSPIAWGAASRQNSIQTYLATNEASAVLPRDQVIGTEKVNILIRHLYGVGERQSQSQQKEDEAERERERDFNRLKRKKKGSNNNGSSTNTNGRTHRQSEGHGKKQRTNNR
mmetsp:Transcript_11402/g.28934  ORF Transcript_11402/g.28934 Transcript_11402/m.28934 type:complete len:161 (-) Transcript_11402:996-1478(-)